MDKIGGWPAGERSWCLHGSGSGLYINVVRRGHVARSGGIWRACAVPLPTDSAARGLGTDLIALSRTLVVMAERGVQICESQAARHFFVRSSQRTAGWLSWAENIVGMAACIGARDFDRETSRLIPRWDFFASDEPSWGIHIFFSIPDLCGEIFLSPCKKRCFLKAAWDIVPFISFLTT